MRGRRKAQREQTITLAHQIEAMARQKRLRSLSAYLKGDERPGANNAAVIAMFDQLAKNGAVKVRRVQRRTD